MSDWEVRAFSPDWEVWNTEDGKYLGTFLAYVSHKSQGTMSHSRYSPFYVVFVAPNGLIGINWTETVALGRSKSRAPLAVKEEKTDE